MIVRILREPPTADAVQRTPCRVRCFLDRDIPEIITRS